MRRRRLAGVPDLQLRIADLERELEEARRAADAAREQARVLDERLTRSARVLSDVMNSPSWRLTKPLRTAKHFLLTAAEPGPPTAKPPLRRP